MPPAADVMRQVVDVMEAAALRLWITLRRASRKPRRRPSPCRRSDRPSRAGSPPMPFSAGTSSARAPTAGSTARPPSRPARARKHARHRPRESAIERAHGPCSCGEARGVRSGLRVHEVVDITLPVDGDRPRAMPGDSGETHGRKGSCSRAGSGCATSTIAKPSVPIGFWRPRWSPAARRVEMGPSRIILERFSD